MEFSKVTVIYFSPTGNSKKYACEIAKRFHGEFNELNLTEYDSRRKKHYFKSDELVIFSAPVYYGRLPIIENGIFENISGENTKSIFTVTYGNREFEDSLLELQNICEKRGFHGIGAGAFIGPHTFSEKIAQNRPDEEDYKIIDEFVDNIKLTKDVSNELKVSGNFPYREINKMPFVPTCGKSCNECGICESVCPVKAIDKHAIKNTNKDLCVGCYACVKQCPENARGISAKEFDAMVNKLEENLTKVDKKPELFYL
jgi:ferredoxin